MMMGMWKGSVAAICLASLWPRELFQNCRITVWVLEAGDGLGCCCSSHAMVVPFSWRNICLIHLDVPHSCNACSLESHPITHSILISTTLQSTFHLTEEEIIEFPQFLRKKKKKVSHFSPIVMVVEALGKLHELLESKGKQFHGKDKTQQCYNTRWHRRHSKRMLIILSIVYTHC